MVLEAKCYVYMISPLASSSTHVRLHAAEPRRMYDFRKYAQSIPAARSDGDGATVIETAAAAAPRPPAAIVAVASTCAAQLTASLPWRQA